MSIRPLPDEVAAQIKSSTAVVSLGGVVLELLKNSLDAKASRIDVIVDFARGGCVVEDDGMGILPSEFSEDGGLGKLYCTSKFHSDEPQLGQHGTFLASLSALSLLTITSHHHGYRTQNSISFHQTQPIARQTPTPAYNHIQGEHGTRVTVRNLFGNMPVRVKQRAMAVNLKPEQHRLRNVLKRDTVGLVLGWQKPVSIKIRDSDGNTIVHLNTANTRVAGSTRGTAAGKPRSAHLSSLLQIMTQANYINVSAWASWVPASASTPAMSVKGAISLEPAPTKQAQFISFGLRPLSSESGGNELYEQVNRLFALSTFGYIEDDVDVDEQEKLRRLSNKRYKNDGYTNRQLKARKGVDRYPMFYLRVSLKDGSADDRFIEDESNLQAVVDVFSAMIEQWLTVHHFRPSKLHQKSDRFQTLSISSQNLVEQTYTPSKKRSVSLSNAAGSSTDIQNSSSAAIRSNKKPRLATEFLEKSLARPRSQAFADWSRIKSGRSSFFEPTNVTQKACTPTSSEPNPDGLLNDTDDHLPRSEGRQENAAFDVAPLTKGSLGGTGNIAPSETGNDTSSVPYDKDETLIWTDPSTSKTFHLNARTGCVLPPRRPCTDSVALSPSTTRLNTSRSLREAPRIPTAEPVRTSWLGYLLQTWDNPIFKPSEQGIQQISLQDGQDQERTRRSQHSHMHCSHWVMQKAFNDAGSTPARLSKDALRRAEVISQVDKKFILVRMIGSPAAEPEAQSYADIVVLVDQHAADERIQVESLLDDLCSPVRNHQRANQQSKVGTHPLVSHVTLKKPLRFAISSREHTHFETFRANFAAWGILYDTSSPVALVSRPGVTEKGTCKLSVTALPPSISERCKADPELLISFLRSAVWKYVESPVPPQAIYTDPNASWIKKIATCPSGLLDMINSRACRSAIMFNDELSLEECKTLISKLAECVFPFMCAHGRPSMVPVVDMGKVGGGDRNGRDDNPTDFVNVWKRWRS